MVRAIACLVVGCLLLGEGFAQDEEVFSGPQAGERLTPFKARAVLGELAGQEFDQVADADGKPIILFFVQEVTRPSLGLTRLLMEYAASRVKDGLHPAVVFLSADPTDTENWMKRAAQALPQSPHVGISVDGPEGPGAYGLNRQVALTVVIGKDDQVTANFALVQPSVQADAPRILKELVAVLGGGPVPTLEELGVRVAPDMGERASDAQLDTLLRALIRLTATAEEVQSVAAAIETYVADQPAAQQRVRSVAKRIVDAGKLTDYGTPAAQAVLKKWAEEAAKAGSAEAPRANQ